MSHANLRTIRDAANDVGDGRIPALPTNATHASISRLLEDATLIGSQVDMSEMMATVLATMIRNAYAIGRADGYRDRMAEEK